MDPMGDGANMFTEKYSFRMGLTTEQKFYGERMNPISLEQRKKGPWLLNEYIGDEILMWG